MSHSPRTTQLALLSLLPIATSCAGVKMASPLSIEALRTAPTAADVGYTNAVGVPSVAERFAERSDLKVAIVQVAYSVQGRPEMTFTSDIWQFGGVTRWKTTTTPEVAVPTTFAQASAVHATKAIESALAAKGFSVVPYETVAATKAYEKHYGSWPLGYSMENSSFTVVGAHPMHVKEVGGLIDFGTLHLVWPDAEALQEIRAELGQDVLMLCVRYQTSTMRGLSGNLIVAGQINVTDPEFVGYGIGGYGHTVTTLDAYTDRNGVPVPGFIEHLDDKQFRVQWTPVFEDLGRVHKAFAEGFAREFHNLAYPPAPQ